MESRQSLSIEAMDKKETVEMADGHEYLVVQGKPYLVYCEIENTHQIRVEERVWKYESNGEIMRDCYVNEIILDYDADEKIIFEYKLKGDTRLDYPTDPEDN